MKNGETENKTSRGGSSWEDQRCCCMFGSGANGADTLKSYIPLPHSLPPTPPPQSLPDRDKVLSIWSATPEMMDWGGFVRTTYVILTSVWHFGLFVLSVMMQRKNKTPTVNKAKWCEGGPRQDKGWRGSCIVLAHVCSKTAVVTRESPWRSGSAGVRRRWTRTGEQVRTWQQKRKGGPGTHLFG